MSNYNTSPYDEGYGDGFHGRTNSNPYQSGSDDYDDYEAGYGDGVAYAAGH